MKKTELARRRRRKKKKTELARAGRRKKKQNDNLTFFINCLGYREIDSLCK